MRFTTKSQPLREAIEAASVAMAGRTTLPVLTCALFECGKDGKVSISCDSLDARMTVVHEALEVDEPFTFLAPPKLLAATLRAEEATITLKAGRLRIESGGESTLVTLPVDEFPPAWKPVPRHSVDALEFLSAIRAATACAGTNSNEFIITCIHWDQAMARMVATDRKMLSATPVALLTDEPFTLPAVSAKAILSSFSVKDELSVGVCGGKACVSAPGRTLWMNLFDGEYLRYGPLIPPSDPFAVVERERLIEALRSLSPFLDENQKVTITPNGALHIHVTNRTGNESRVMVEATINTKTQPFAANANNLLAICKNWTCDRVAVTRSDYVLLLHPESPTGQIGLVTLFREPA